MYCTVQQNVKKGASELFILFYFILFNSNSNSNSSQVRFKQPYNTYNMIHTNKNGHLRRKERKRKEKDKDKSAPFIRSGQMRSDQHQERPGYSVPPPHTWFEITCDILYVRTCCTPHAQYVTAPSSPSVFPFG